MQQWLYALALVVSLLGLVVLDRRFGLAFYYDAKRAATALLLSIIFFVVWDLAGIRAGIFHHGGSAYALPYRLMPEFPVEELLFLCLLTYVTLLLYRAGEVRWPRT